MRRAKYKEMNRTRNGFHRNILSLHTLSPDVFVEHIWMQDDEAKMEIIEIDSSDPESVPNNDNSSNYENIKKSDDISRTEYSYKINQRAREKSHVENGHYCQTCSPDTAEDNHFNDIVTDFVYAKVYGSDLAQGHQTKNRRRNLFTIINRPFNCSDSSSDDIEIVDFTDTHDDYYQCSDSDENKVMTSDEDCANKQALWIYSYKNKQLVPEKSVELLNLASKSSSSSTSCSFNNCSEETELILDKLTRRVESPIPTYVPRLNLLGPALPTVTEIPEPSMCYREINAENIDVNGNINSPFHEKIASHCNSKQDKYTNTKIINWMCLSPRERQRPKVTCSNTEHELNIPKVSESPSDPCIEKSVRKSSILNTIETMAEINVKENEPNKRKVTLKSNEYQNTPLFEIEADSFDTEEQDPGGVLTNKQHIRIPHMSLKTKSVTYPIEKFKSNNWILEDVNVLMGNIFNGSSEIDFNKSDIEPKTDVNSFDGCSGNSLLKSAQCIEIREISDSIPSLQLSIDTISEKESWLSRLVKCFRCFK